MKLINKIKNKNNLRRKGFSLLEIIVYLGILTFMTVLIINSIFSLFKNFNIIKANQSMEANAISILDKMTRDIRDSKNILTNQSSFGVYNGMLSLQIASSTNENSSTTIKYYMENEAIKYMQNGILLGNLSNKEIKVDNFKLYYFTINGYDAIKIELNLKTNPHLASTTISKNFYTTIHSRE